jgi:hypothetical protein
MAGFHVSVSHRLGRETARERVAEFVHSVQTQYASDISDADGRWDGDRLLFSLSARGLAISGTLVVGAEQVVVSGPLPLMAMMFRGRVEQTIRAELERLLE